MKSTQKISVEKVVLNDQGKNEGNCDNEPSDNNNGNAFKGKNSWSSLLIGRIAKLFWKVDSAFVNFMTAIFILRLFKNGDNNIDINCGARVTSRYKVAKASSNVFKSYQNSSVFNGWLELDSHADTFLDVRKKLLIYYT